MCMNIDRKIVYMLLIIVLSAGFFGYYYIKPLGAVKVSNAQESEISKHQQVTKIISIGTVSDDAVKQITRFQPTADYIAAKLSDNETRYEGKVIVAKTIENMTGLLKEQKLDLYIESPFGTVLVAKKSGSVPFLRRWKDGVAEYHSVFIAKKDTSINTLSNFVGKTIVFEDPGSTSGYFLPKAYLIQKGFNLSQSAGENNIVYIFSGEGENIPLWVIEGKADIGAFNNIEFDALPESVKNKVKIIDRTEDVPRHIVSHRSGMDPALVEKVKQILMNMDRDAQGIEILKNFQKTKKYDEISKDLVFNASKMLDLLEQ